MKKNILIFLLLTVVGIAFGQKADLNTGTGGTPVINPVPALMQPKLQSTAPVIFDNGPLVTTPGGGYGGADLSVLQTTLGLDIYGAGFQYSYNNRMADDFTFSEGKRISSIVLFGYQTGSSTTSTISAAYIQIYDRKPDLPGATVVWGNRTTNRLSSTSFTNIYRAPDYDPNNSGRPIMRVVCNVDITLPAGTYWLETSLDGPSSYPGPWCPLVTISGQTSTGNAIQYMPSNGWSNYLDDGTLTPQGMPFLLQGVPAVPFKMGYLAVIFVLIAAGIVIRRRFI